jgi:hypothetical protein
MALYLQMETSMRTRLLLQSRLPCLLLVIVAIICRAFATSDNGPEFWVYCAAVIACCVRCWSVSTWLALYGPLIWLGVPIYYAMILLGFELWEPGWLGFALDESVSLWMILAATVHRDEGGALRILEQARPPDLAAAD